MILAVGGGVICDLAGFLAATYLRGIPFISLPTTLLAMVDAAVGGKTGVNHPRGKNLIGAFHQPRAVFADVDLLSTLPERQYRSGLAEVVKSAVIGNSRLFSVLERSAARILSREPSVLIDLVVACCRLKARVVEQDAGETNLRAVLNFGHTLGHAIEHLSRYRLTHGEAISIGMVLEARAATAARILREGDADRIEALLKRLGLPRRLPKSFSPARLLRAARQDKKVQGQEIRYALPRKIGTMARKRGRFTLTLPPAIVSEFMFGS